LSFTVKVVAWGACSDGGGINSDGGVLLLRQVAPDRMEAVGYGEAYPVASNDTEAGRAQNRRVSILVRGKA